MLQDQPLGDAVANDRERKALSIVREHVTRSWQKALGTEPSDSELRQLFCLIHVHVLDIEEGGADENHVKDLLRRTILRDPDQDDAAWGLLVSLCASLAAQRSGTDRSGLLRALLNAGLKLKASRSYQNDIEKLKKYSTTAFEGLAHLAQIRIGSTAIKIQRPSTEALRHAVEENSILVVGEPGAGKSGALHDLVEGSKEGRDCVFLAVDRLAAGSLGELHAEIGLGHELPEVLDNWPGTQPAFLIIDALDAARGSPADRMIRDLIRLFIEKKSRWRVVASIRKFDLRYGEEIKELFAGSPPTVFQDAEFASVRHLNVPPLSEDELDQIASQSPELYELARNAPAELNDLLRVPFNLKLMAELLGEGVPTHELTPITTHLQLLNKYWKHRVISLDGLGNAREAVLRKACEKMVEARALRVDRSEVAESETSIHLDNLLSSQVLVEWQPSPEAKSERYVLAFSHHVLFDYAVACLLLRGLPEKAVTRLATDPELTIFARPSFLLHSHHLWTVDSTRHQFWDFVLRVIRADQIPEIGKLIGPSVAAELARSLSDIEPLCVALDDSTHENQNAAEQALRHLVGALLAGVHHEVTLVGPDAGPWCQLLECISRSLRSPVAYAVRSLLSTICDRPEKFTSDQRIAAGCTARRLLEFAWSQAHRDGWLAIHALQCVCKTFESDPTASAALIRRCLEVPHISQYGFEEMPWLAREVNRLISLDQRLVEEIYRIAFGYQEASKEPTPIGQSRILPLISNRRQDYEMALYELAEVFPTFLEHAPENATRALIDVMEAYVVQRHPPVSGEWHEDTFDLDGRRACLRTDYSSIWDEGDTYRHDEPLRMLDAFQQYLERLAERQEDIERLRQLVQILISENRLAVLFRRALRVAARCPAAVCNDILPFAWAIPILTCYDTTTPAGEFLKAIFPTLGLRERERIERAILSIPEAVPEDHRKAGEHIRNRLLGCLTDDKLVTDEAQRVLEQLRASNAVPPNEPPVRFEAWSRPYGEEEYLREQGVSVEAEPNRKIRELERPVKEFADKHLNSTPTLEEVSGVLTPLKTLYEALSGADIDAVHPKQRDHAWGSLAAACGRIGRNDGLSCEEPAGSFVKTVLLEASGHAEPTHDPADDAQFDEHPSWGGPAPRIEATEGLIVLARSPSCATLEVVEALERLSNDPVPAVRFQIASHLNALYRTAADLMWRITERMCREEPSRGVLQGLLSGPIQRLAGAEPDRIASLTRTIFDRVREGPGAKIVREFCVGILAGLYIWRDLAQCGEVTLDIAMNSAAYPDEAPHLLAHLREPLTHGPIHPADPARDAIRRRALDLLDRILRSAYDGLREIERRHSGVPLNDWPPQDQESIKSLAHLINNVGSTVYFSSGAYDRKAQGQPREDQPLTRERAQRFYREAGSILDQLADIGYPSVTHHLLETLEAFISGDPRGVFIRIGRVVRAGQQGGYQYESLAAELIVKLVERYLAEYRTLLREDAECRQALINILDIFVQAGWPSARRLSYQLEEIFR
jgi:DNA-binding transcriptional ArsR family regulator